MRVAKMLELLAQSAADLGVNQQDEKWVFGGRKPYERFHRRPRERSENATYSISYFGGGSPNLSLPQLGVTSVSQLHLLSAFTDTTPPNGLAAPGPE